MPKASPAVTSSAGKKQSTLLGFFKKPSTAGGPPPSSSSPIQKPHASSKTPLAASSQKNAPPAYGPAMSSPLAAVSSKFKPIEKLAVVLDGEKEAAERDDDLSSLLGPSSPTRPPPSSDAPGEPEASEDVAMDGGDDDFPITTARSKRRKAIVESDSEEEDGPAVKKLSRKSSAKKRADSDDDYDFGMDDEDLLAAAEEFDGGDASDAESDIPSEISDETPKKRKKPIPASKSSSNGKTKSTPSSLSRPAPRPSTNGSGSNSNSFLTQAELRRLNEKEEKRAAEDCYDFIKDIRDKDGIRPGSPNYDPRTIRIPSTAWQKFTPFEKQFWEIKQNHWDTVLFFQKGKFFELYENDARIGNEEFGLKLTDRVKMCMVGVPEQQFEIWAAKFLAAGYKVGRVEQVETALGAKMRNATPAKGKKAPAAPGIVNRELKHVLTNGTVSDPSYLTGDEASHCISIKEYSPSPHQPSSFGITILDAATGAFSLSGFDDDLVKTRLETMFRQLRPKELIYEKGDLSVSTLRTLRSILPSSCVWTALRPKDTCTAEQTIDLLVDFFPPKEDAPVNANGDDKSLHGLPEALNGALDQPLVLASLGGMIAYLKQLNLDKDLLSQKNFDVYDPIRNNQALVLDGSTLSHLEILENNEGGEDGSLLKILQRCVTAFGKRLFRIWLCSPLQQTKAINDRLDAIEEIMNHTSFEDRFRKFAKGLPDLERLISRIHAQSCKISDFSRVIESFDELQRGLEQLGQVAEGFESTSVSALIRSAPDLTPHLEHVRSMYTYENGTLLPVEGADEAYEEIMAEIADIEGKLEELREQYVKELKTKSVVYWHSSQGQKEIYQVEVPAKTVVPKNWTKTGSTKAVARYQTPRTTPLIQSLQEARETRTGAVKSFVKRVFNEFDLERTVWLRAVKTVAELDCLGSLALASRDLDEPKCRPTFVESDVATLDFEELRHPSMCLTKDFIPNDVKLGGDAARTVLLTGPNMAGKSTLLRMTAAGVIMAQLGMYVPARKATLSPIDKIQTRMGAYDNMFASQSTFRVELEEASKILREAGPKSLVILDELGRGTSTYDGMAIAGAVLHYLATQTLPLGFFATHYGSLTDDYAYHPNIRSMHMSSVVNEEKREVTFLYKLIEGRAESSYGTHVAHLAGVPMSVVTRAEQLSATFFAESTRRLEQRRMSSLPLVAHADFAYLHRLAISPAAEANGETTTMPGGVIGKVLNVLREAAGRYATPAQEATVSMVEG